MQARSKRPDNGILRIYNMFPTSFGKIPEMTAYLPKLAELGMNTVWLNPLQWSDNVALDKADALSGVTTHVSYSMYAMADDIAFDPRFSLADYDRDENVVLTPALEERLDIKDFNELKKLSRRAANILSESKKINSKIGVVNHLILDLETERDAFVEKMKAKDALLISLGAELNAVIKKIVALRKSKQNNPKENDSLSKKKSDLVRWLKKRTANLLYFVENKKSFSHERDKLEARKLYLDAKKNQRKNLLKENYLCQREIVARADKLALKEFTSQCKHYNMSPIFDLVMNHVQKNSPVHLQNKHWFNDEDGTYIDAVAFEYGLLVDDKYKGKFEAVRDADDYEIAIDQEKTRLEALVKEVFEALWKPLIHNYIHVMGFSGARVDCVRKVPLLLRSMAYSYMKELIPDPIILEEALFSEKSPKEFAESLGNAGATHITGSVYYQARGWHGGLHLSGSIGDSEETQKRKIVKNGVVNFTGNHDHLSAAATVAEDQAIQLLKLKDPELHVIYAKRNEELKEKPEATRSAFMRNFLYAYVKEIQNYLNFPEKFSQQVTSFGMAYLDKMALNMLSSSGGYYMLAGDEKASFATPSVFCRENRQPMFIEFGVDILKDVNLFTTEISDRYAINIKNTLRSLSLVLFLDKNKKSYLDLLNGYSSYILDKVKSLRLPEKSADDTSKNEIKTIQKIIGDILASHEDENKKFQKKSFSTNDLSRFMAKLVKDSSVASLREFESILSDLRPHLVGETKVKIDRFFGQVNRLLLPFFDHLLTMLHANHEPTLEKLETEMVNSKMISRRKFKELFSQRNHHPGVSPKNDWKMPVGLEAFTDTAYFKHLNHILDCLPASNDGFWCETFKLERSNSKQFSVFVRKNGSGFESATDIIFINLNPTKSLCVTLDDIKTIASWFQQRHFPPLEGKDYFDFYHGDRNFHLAYCCIDQTESNIYGQPIPNVYLSDGITLDKPLRNAAKHKKIKIVVETDAPAHASKGTHEPLFQRHASSPQTNFVYEDEMEYGEGKVAAAGVDFDADALLPPLHLSTRSKKALNTRSASASMPTLTEYEDSFENIEVDLDKTAVTLDGAVASVVEIGDTQPAKKSDEKCVPAQLGSKPEESKAGFVDAGYESKKNNELETEVVTAVETVSSELPERSDKGDIQVEPTFNNQSVPALALTQQVDGDDFVDSEYDSGSDSDEIVSEADTSVISVIENGGSQIAEQSGRPTMAVERANRRLLEKTCTLYPSSGSGTFFEFKERLETGLKDNPHVIPENLKCK